MKPIKFIILALSLASCGSGSGSGSEIFTTNSNLVVYIDSETKCQYISQSSTGGLTPRLSKDGKHICK